MKLSTSAIHYKFWMLNYSRGKYYTPDNNFCNYFWSLIWAIIFLPLTWMGLIYKAITKENNSFVLNVLNTVLGYFIIGTIALLLVGVIINTKAFFIGLVLVAVALALMFGIFYFFYEIYPNTSFRKNIKETYSIVVEGIKSFKESYCPQILWDKEHSEEDTNFGN